MSEREKFEAYVMTQGVDFKYLSNIVFNGTDYELMHDDEEYEGALAEIRLGWATWQAARADLLEDMELNKLADAAKTQKRIAVNLEDL